MCPAAKEKALPGFGADFAIEYIYSPFAALPVGFQVIIVVPIVPRWKQVLPDAQNDPKIDCVFVPGPMCIFL
jgi:hypothetical protein